jgi:hypothetical protein
MNLKLDEKINFINWFKDFVTEIQEFFHQILFWLEGNDEDSPWPGRVIMQLLEDAAAKKSSTDA